MRLQHFKHVPLLCPGLQEPSLDRLAKGGGAANAKLTLDGSSGDSLASEGGVEKGAGKHGLSVSGVSGSSGEEAQESVHYPMASFVANLHMLASVLACTGKVRVSCFDYSLLCLCVWLCW